MFSRLATSLLLVSVLLLVGCSRSSPTAPRPSGPASLLVRSEPGNLLVYVDGTSADVRTPATLSLAAGQHQISLSLLGYRDTTVALTVVAATVDTLDVTLGAGPGTPRSFSVWQSFAWAPVAIAAAPDGPVYVIAGVADGTRALYAYSLAGDLLGSGSLGYAQARRLAVGPSGDAYLAHDIPGLIHPLLERYTPDGHLLNTIYYTNAGGSWPADPCAAAGTGDTLMVLCNLQAVLGQMSLYVNDHFVGVWRNGINADQLVVDRTARRCYVLGVSDTIKVFTTGGLPITSWKVGSNFNYRPGTMAIAPDGTVYTTDWSGIIRRFSGTGALLGEWATGGIGSLVGVAVDALGRVYVAGTGTRQVVRYVP